jgi:hypothetical protein
VAYRPRLRPAGAPLRLRHATALYLGGLAAADRDLVGLGVAFARAGGGRAGAAMAVVRAAAGAGQRSGHRRGAAGRSPGWRRRARLPRLDLPTACPPTPAPWWWCRRCGRASRRPRSWWRTSRCWRWATSTAHPLRPARRLPRRPSRGDARGRRDPRRRRAGIEELNANTPPTGAATASSSSTASGGGTPARGPGWAGSASAASSRSSTACCAGRPTPPCGSRSGDLRAAPRGALLHHARLRHPAAARRRASLIGIIAHPLNRPVVDPRLGRVTEGYGILQPRVSVTMASAAGSLFARLYAGHTGVDPYTTAVSDTYQDLFGEGIFTGKGLYDVDAFSAALEGRVPEYALLSHDLFEGIYARTALVSDVELVDDYPGNVLAHARRQHRWVRGDWQILRWLFPWVRDRSGGRRRNRLPLISRWKILDNLRRSLVPPATLALLLAAWTFLPGNAGGVDGGHRRPRLPGLPAAARCARRPRAAPALAGLPARRRRRPGGGAGAGRAAARLPGQPGVADGARDHHHAGAPGHPTPAARVGDRRRQRRTLGAARRAGAAALPARHGGEPARRRRHPAAGRATRPRRCRWRCRCWCCGCSRRPSPTCSAARWCRASSSSTPRTAAYLEGVARATWHYFATFTGAGDHGLPPDNFQEIPEPRIAHRTSPTNIGMGLLSTLAAHDLGFIDTGELIERTDATLTTIEGSSATRGTCSTGTTRRPSRRCCRATSRRSTAATSPVRCCAWPRGCGAWRRSPAPSPAMPSPAMRPPSASPPWRSAPPPSPTACGSASSTTPAPHLRHRLPAGGRRGAGAARRLVLRPARLGGAARQLPRHRPGRRAAEPLVPPRPPDHQRRRRAHPAVVERHRLRVPDAAAADAQLPRDAARPELPHGGARAAALRQRARRAVGDLGVGLQRRRPPRHLPVQGLRRPRARAQARAGRRVGHRPLRHRAGGDGRPRRRRCATCAGSPRRGWPASTASTRRSTTPTARRATTTPCRPPAAARWCAPTWRTTRG